jgi:hypothetical protein
MVPYLLTKTEKIPYTTICGKVYADLFWDERGVILEHYMPRGNTVTTAMYADLLKNHQHPAIKPKQRGRLSTGVCSNVTVLSPILPLQLLQQSKICPSSVFQIHYSCQTSPPVTFMFLDRAERRWEASLSGPTKRCSRQCTSDCALSQKNFFLEVSVHFQIAETLVWNALKTT